MGRGVCGFGGKVLAAKYLLLNDSWLKKSSETLLCFKVFSMGLEEKCYSQNILESNVSQNWSCDFVPNNKLLNDNLPKKVKFNTLCYKVFVVLEEKCCSQNILESKASQNDAVTMCQIWNCQMTFGLEVMG